MKKDKKGFGEFNIKLGQTETFAIKLLAAKYDMNVSQVVTMALDEYYRKKLTRRDKEGLSDELSCNQLIGEHINNNRGVFGYDEEMNDVPEDKKHMFLEVVWEET